MNNALIIASIVALVAILGLAWNASSTGAYIAGRSHSYFNTCPEGRMHLMQIANGQFSHVCVAMNDPVYGQSDPNRQAMQKGLPVSKIPTSDRSYQQWCDRFPDACAQ